MILFFKVLYFCLLLVYQYVFLLNECSGIFNFTHQLHSKVNVALIFKLYLFSFFSQFFNGMDAFTQVILATVFYAVSIIFLPHILLGFNYLPLVTLRYIVLFIEDIFKKANNYSKIGFVTTPTTLQT